MISQKLPEIQQPSPNIPNIFRDVPAVVIDGDACAYILVKELHAEMDEFVNTGEINTVELHVFSLDYEQELIRTWEAKGLKCTYRRQRLEYMRKSVTIIYIEVSNPQTGVRLSLIPWFMLPGRPYPIFVYLYAICHYNNSVQKSMMLSALATKQLYKISGFSKSTISRAIKVMGPFISSLQMDKPISIEEPEIASAAETIDCISELLENSQAIKSLKEAFGTKAACLPPVIRRGKSIAHALSLIPNELFMVIKEKGPEPKKNRDTRKRPARQRIRKTLSVKRKPDFVENHRLEQIRLKFISLCKAIVLNAAVMYHRFLI